MTYSSKKEDAFVARFEGRFAETREEAPLTQEEALEIFTAYKALLRRFGKIARISDSYQFELHDLKTRYEHASRIDFLTGLSNRLDMSEQLEAEQARSLRHGRSFAIIMADIDKFKSINDTHGHDMGDQTLAAIARTFSGCLRKEDGCARWGGDEFLVMLPETDREEAIEVGERLRALTENLAFKGETWIVRATISLGISLYEEGETVDECVKRADEALYRAKNSGRNSLVFLGYEGFKK